MKRTNLLPNAKNKKERIWELVSDGKYTTDQIASMVHTTKDYVWKETSRLKKSKMEESLIVSSTTKLSKTKDETSLIFQRTFDGEQNHGNHSISCSQPRTPMTDRSFPNNKSNKYLDIPDMGPEDLKTLYSEFNAGKKPFDVIADQGYHPDVVEFEYHRFMRLTDRDSYALLRTIIADCEAYSKPAEKLVLLIKKYYNEGYLSNNDIYELIKLRIEHESQSSLESLMLSSTNPLAESIVRLRCNVCKKQLSGALLDSRSEIGKTILDQISHVLCSTCKLEEYDVMRRQYFSQPSLK